VASGEGDRAAVAEASAAGATGLKPLAGQLVWFVDEAANPVAGGGDGGGGG